MALRKTITDAKGVVTNYHKVGNFSVRECPKIEGVDADEYSICVQVLSFVSEEYRLISETNVVIKFDRHIKVTLGEISATPIITLIYNKLKEHPAFKDAEDC